MHLRGLIGVVHLPALPGDPAYRAGGFEGAYARAWADAEALVSGGVVGLIVENFGSAPFVKGSAGDRTPPQQAAALALVCARSKQLGVPVGVNCLRNDAHTALGIAAACGLDFIRVNVHTGAYVTDQGLIEGEAASTLRQRELLGARAVQIWADVLVKHATPLAPLEPETATHDCIDRGLADAVIVTGAATGAPVDPALLERVRGAASGRPVVIGSGLGPKNAQALLPHADAAIVGTHFKRGGVVREPVDPKRVRDMVERCSDLFASA
ncbi:photosystem I biogenesis protein BtpA [Enhygromyxa salina]|uniref:Photosystem I biogenesis protein BtpA n=1 Tax=Enhygromyxa salina TaxID=215803 RepID=A0A0C2DA37_9BACT|nr:BtpA/SgcQ family protein [Enhygromyxa salina]KIG16757.1 photosystem I biogenesis protein BtpA [Enhygromyxa salina]